MSKKRAKSSMELEESLEEMMETCQSDYEHLEPNLYDPNSKKFFPLISYAWSQ